MSNILNNPKSLSFGELTDEMNTKHGLSSIEEIDSEKINEKWGKMNKKSGRMPPDKRI